jgi:hypothetical protein
MAGWRLHKLPLLLSIFCVLLYGLIAYDLARTEVIKLLLLYSALFLVTFQLIKQEKNNLRLLFILAIIFRGVFIAATPNLSQDFYRFIWDGRMILEGWNPYLYLPKDLLASGTAPVWQAQELLDGMGELSAKHYTNYPPINQLCFIIAGLFAGKSILGSVIVMRILMIAADVGIIYFGKKLLAKLQLPLHHIFWYALNPFIIIELTGNLHFEGVMLFFIVWSMYLLVINKWQWAAVVFALSISVKLIPLLLLPLFFQYFFKKSEEEQSAIIETKVPVLSRPIKRLGKLFWFYIIVLAITLLLFAPFFSSEFITNYKETVGLWFSNFEFNASFYYVARAIGYSARNRNEIAIIGKFIPLLVILIVLGLSLLRKNKTPQQLLTAMLFALAAYFFVSTTVHPWYLASLVLLTVFTKYRFPLVWSFSIVLSYLAYTNVDNKENLFILGLEYTAVYGYLIWELFFKPKTKIA